MALVRIIAGWALLGSMGWGILVLFQSEDLAVTSVQIRGIFRHVTRQQLAKTVLPHARGGFFTVDVDGVRNSLKALPWVRSARVQRVWPNRLRITVTEQKAVARWGRQGLLNETGELFIPGNYDLIPALPELNGPAGTEAYLLKQLYALEKSLFAVHQRIRRLSMDERRSWRLVLDNGTELVLGRGNVQRRLDRFVQVYPRLKASRAGVMRRVDLRYANGLAVVWTDKHGESADQNDPLPTVSAVDQRNRVIGYQG
jgi:cell division protein FtsQ